MEIIYDKAALHEYMDDIGNVGESLQRAQDQGMSRYNACRQHHERLKTEVEQEVRRAYNMVEAAESHQREADAEYQDAMRMLDNAEDESQASAAQNKLRHAQQMQAEAAQEMAQASAEYEKARAIERRLAEIGERHQPAAESAVNQVEDGLSSFNTLVSSGNSDLGEYMGFMDKSKSALYDGPASSSFGSSASGGAVSSAGSSDSGSGSISGSRFGFIASAGPTASAGASAEPPSTSGASTGFGSHSAPHVGLSSGASFSGTPSGAPSPAGWCAKNRMTAVHINETGTKSVSMTIGGVERSYPCTKSGMARAYRHATKSGNQDMIARTSAMFEIETLRESLELGSGESGFTQLGGYHADVKMQDPAGYESHHIPSQSVQDEIGDLLPTLSITYDDHKLTSSYAGKQRKTYHYAFPTNVPETTYKESILQSMEQGSPGYIESVKNELLDLRCTTGHRYDGGVSAYLDAVIDMLSTRGIPAAKRGDKK